MRKTKNIALYRKATGSDAKIGDEEIGDEEIGDEEIGDEAIGHEAIGHEAIGHEAIGSGSGHSKTGSGDETRTGDEKIVEHKREAAAAPAET